MFFHTVPVTKTLSHEACAFLENGQYSHLTLCPYTGRQHTRYFDTLGDFVKWHYISRGHTILDENFRFESEIKVLGLFPTVDDISVDLKRTIQHADLERFIMRGTSLNTTIWSL
jgi:hypothetical protein